MPHTVQPVAATTVGKDSSGITGNAKFLVYLNHFITGWDDHVWWFALGLFLVEITPESLTFTASYGLAAGGAVLIFGPVVGDWVDRTRRLTVARVSVLVNNVALIICALLIFVVIEYKPYIKMVWPDEGMLKLCNAGIILIAIIANMSNMARKTAVERDWIVEICDKDKDMLATLSATMRRISLFTMVLAPLATGQLLGLASHSVGAISVAVWNFLTIFVEYFLLWKIYKVVPQLQRTKSSDTDYPHKLSTSLTTMPDVGGAVECSEFTVVEENSGTTQEKVDLQEEEIPRSYLTSAFSSCITLHKGWKVYQSYDVAFAGLALASLYLTVLGFDGITSGFAISQGLSEGLVGGLLATASASGIVGTILYPYIRRKIGLHRTGLYALAAEISSLTLCVISIWCPGSPFDPMFYFRSHDDQQLSGDFKMFPNNSNISRNHSDNATAEFIANQTMVTYTDDPEIRSYISISLLMTGIIGARIGLWMSDLTITQLFLESVHVSQRGIVGGVQNALNQMMDMFKFGLVILLPVPPVFGYLVILSFCFICLAWFLFAVYVKRARGYILPWNKPQQSSVVVTNLAKL